MYDPFRIQFLTVSLDSEIVLALIGVLLAGLVARDAARRSGRSPDGLWDAAVNVGYWMIVAARLGWVASHFEYYGRAPLQIVAVGDGGFLFGGGVLAAFWLLRRYRARLGLSWTEIGAIMVPAFVVALLLDRAGCALAACGAGHPSNAPWAVVRSGVGLEPIGMYGVGVWLTAWWILRCAPGSVVARREWFVLFGALLVDRSVAWGLGYDGVDSVAVAGALVVLAIVARWHRYGGFADPRRRSDHLNPSG